MITYIPGKKTFNDNHEPQQENKRTKIESTINAVGYLAFVIFHTDHYRAANNVAYVNSQLFKNIFPLEKENEAYLKIDNFAIKAKQDVTLLRDQIDVSFATYSDIEENLIPSGSQSLIRIEPFSHRKEKVRILKAVHIKVYSLNQVRRNKKKIRVLKQIIKDQVISTLNDRILTVQQSFFVSHPSLGKLKIKVDRWAPEEVQYGFLDGETHISFSSMSNKEFSIAEECDPVSIKQFNFVIKKVRRIAQNIYSANADKEKEVWKEGVQSLPLILPFTQVVEKIRQCANMQLEIGSNIEFSFGKHWNYKVKLESVEMAPEKSDSKHIEIADEYKENYLKLFYLRNSDFNLQACDPEQVLLCESFEKAQQAQELKFEIIDFCSNNYLEKNEIPWESVQDLSQEILSSKKQIVEKEKITIDINQRRYLLVLKEAIGQVCDEKNKNLCSVWALDKKTEIKIFPSSLLQLKIVDTSHPFPLLSINAKVAIVNQTLSENFDNIQNYKEEKKFIKEEELQKIFRESIPSDRLLHENQTIRGISGKGLEIEFKLNHLVTNKKHLETYYGSLYELLPETIIKFEEDKESSLIITFSDSQKINSENIHQKLLELGIGGIPKKFKTSLTQIILSRNTYSMHRKELGQKPHKGLLLYGPPGTGKTLLARNLGKLFGISNENTKIFTGSEIWKKYLGESEKAVLDMFASAREDQKLNGDKSRQHMIIIDEIEAMLPRRDNAEKRYETSVVDAFLAAFGGISSRGDQPLDNIMVIGLTNNFDKIDEAAKRPGRLFPHLYVGLPNKKGRKEIFEIHTKLIKEKGFLAHDVNIDEIVEMTVGMSGAFIESLVISATNRSLQRIDEYKISSENIGLHPTAKVCRQDFIEAFSVNLGKKKSECFIQNTATDVKGICESLKTLGLGGISNEAIQFLSDLKIYHRYKPYVSRPFFKGLFLYGQHGTGKTRFAKAIKNLFSLQGNRFQYLRSSELWPLQGSQLKNQMKAIFNPALEASKDSKHEAPLFVIVIDELEGLYRKDDVDPKFSSLNKFLAEVQPFFEEPTELRNLLLIGISHDSLFAKYDSFQRQGLCKHIEMEVPSQEGRKEILEIYLKHFIGNNQLVVDIEELVNMTIGYTGAQIEGLVTEAQTIALRRVAQANLWIEDLRLTKKDFQIAAKQEGKTSKNLMFN